MLAWAWLAAKASRLAAQTVCSHREKRRVGGSRFILTFIRFGCLIVKLLGDAVLRFEAIFFHLAIVMPRGVRLNFLRQIGVFPEFNAAVFRGGSRSVPLPSRRNDLLELCSRLRFDYNRLSEHSRHNMQRGHDHSPDPGWIRSLGRDL